MFANGAENDVLVMGRVGVDMYAHDVDTDFSDASLFVKQVGGSAGNMAVGLARAGCTVGFYGKVAADMLGDFVHQYMHQQGIDIQGLTRTTGQAKTPLAICETKAENCGAVLYRNNASDVHISPQDVDADYVKRFKALIVTGTGLSQNPSTDATYTAIQYAKKHSVTTILDLDYRRDAWQSSSHAQRQFRTACMQVDCVVGNVQEFQVLCDGDIQGDKQSEQVPLPNGWCVSGAISAYVAQLRQNGTTVVLKNGQYGCVVYRPHALPLFSGVYTVQPLKPYGAGDAFASTLIAHLIQHRHTDTHTAWHQALIRGSAAAALVVCRFGCAYALPTAAEVDDFIASHTIGHMPIQIRKEKIL